ncbi:MAG: hypothetical protein QOH05_3792, partial [Acetobacteraceae bacterium]|nr:hypothetical protein [Acetobacteraceae bacterium]
LPRPGKLEIQATKPLANQRDLALAYSPGVAAACMEIAKNPAEAATLTARANLVAVVSNGTAVLGLGNIGPLASTPVMEGKAVLFKKFAGIDVFDIEIAADTIERVVETVAALEPTFGGINLEDIKGPECFEIEAQLKERMKIPVFHDDQHGTAIIVGAAITNALLLNGKKLADVKIVCSGAGAAAIACLNLLVSLGAQRKNIWVCDIDGLVHEGRNTLMDRWKAVYAQKTEKRTLGDVIGGADIFLGLSAPNVLKPDMVKSMADHPLVMALANPDPEIMPEEARKARPDAMICTGRSDFPNQVNNVLCFPFIFRGALDVWATTINEAMKIAAVEAIAKLARVEASEVVAAAYGGSAPVFGPDYIIPKPFDPRLILEIAPAVARAAIESGVARRPITDFQAYQRDLERFVFRSGYLMRPVFEAAMRDPKRVVFAEGEDERILRAAQTLVDDAIARPILLGRRDVIAAKVKDMGLRLALGDTVQILDPVLDRDVYDRLIPEYQRLSGRRGTPPEPAARRVATRASVAAAMLLHDGQADAAICGGTGGWWRQIQYILPIIPRRPDVNRVYALSCLIIPSGVLFICDTFMVTDPTAEQVTEMTLLAAEVVRGFGLIPKAALVSHSSFGASDSASARKMRQALGMIRARAPGLEIDGEMHADAALVQAIRDRAVPDSKLGGSANLLIMPTLDAANISFNLLKAAADGLPVGPILLGMSKPIHVVVPSVTARGIVNLSALAVVEAQEQASLSPPA